MNFRLALALIAPCLALANCASIVEGTTQAVAVTSPPADGAKCALSSSEGTYYITTPGSTTISKTKNDLHVECDKPGYQHASKTVASHFNGATLGNILLGGIVGIGIDAATGANFNYPTDIAVPMVPVPAKPVAAGAPATEAAKDNGA